jgi:hypothetical protein
LIRSNKLRCKGGLPIREGGSGITIKIGDKKRMLIKYGKEMIEVGDVGVETSVDELKDRLEFVTGCSDIKLILTGKVLIGGPLKTIGKLPGGLLAKISMIGSKKVDVDLVEQAQQAQLGRDNRRIINDLDASLSFTGSSSDSSRGRPVQRSQYCFGSITTLPGLGNESTARQILEDLSNDVGVYRYSISLDMNRYFPFSLSRV